MKRTSFIGVLFALIAFAATAADSPWNIQDSSESPRSEVPVEYTWNLDDIFSDEEAWRAGLTEVEGMLPILQSKAAVWTESAANALEFLRTMTTVEEAYLRVNKYAYLRGIGEVSNPEPTSMLGEARALGIEIGLVGSGLREQILELGEETFAAYMSEEPGLSVFAFDINEVLRGRAHTLSEAEQRIADRTALFTNAPAKIFNLLNDSEIPNPTITLADGSEVTLNRSTYHRLMESQVRPDRILASETYWANQNAFADSLAATLDAGCKQHLFDAQIRNFDSSLEAALFDEDIDPEVYHNAIRQIRSRADLLQRYLTLKKKLLGLDTLRIEDGSVNAVAAVDRAYGWDDAATILAEAFKPLGPEYAKVVSRAFTERWMDRYPNKDKQSGAFSSMVYGVHPYIKMNYQGQYSEVSTLAHELGHAVQSHLSAENQPFNLASYPAYVSEVASIFNEHLLNHYLLTSDPDPLFRLYLLDEYMKRARTVVFFAAILSELELRMHEHVETGGTVTADFMNRNTLELLRHYYGHDSGVCEIGEHVQATWSIYPHLFMNFYLLSYSNGFIASMAASEMLLQDEGYRDSYLEYLSAGGSAHALDLLRIAEVDLAEDTPFVLAFRGIERVLGEMENLVQQLETEGRL